MATRKQSKKKVETLKHKEARRKNIPTAEYQSVLQKEEQSPIRVAYERRNRDLDPQLVWRGKDEQDWSDLVVNAAPLYIQEKVHPKVLIDDLTRRSSADAKNFEPQAELFADFNGLASDATRTEFYQHDSNWTNRLILGDSLQVMASLAERETLSGKVQCIYFDPPYGIKFNSNFQWSTTSREVKERAQDITREPEVVKAFRDTWRDGIHSYLTYLRDRLSVARDLLSESGSIFVQIGDENAHRVRALMDEVFGEENFCALISFAKSSGTTSEILPSPNDLLVWYSRDRPRIKYRQVFLSKQAGGAGGGEYGKVLLPDGARRGLTDDETRNTEELPNGARIYRNDNFISQGFRQFTTVPFNFQGNTYHPGTEMNWKTTVDGLKRLAASSRIEARANSLSYIRFLDDFPVFALNKIWSDTGIAGRPGDKIYVVQTSPKVIERCVLMTTDPGDLSARPHLRFGYECICGRAVGSSMDHD